MLYEYNRSLRICLKEFFWILTQKVKSRKDFIFLYFKDKIRWNYDLIIILKKQIKEIEREMKLKEIYFFKTKSKDLKNKCFEEK